MKRIKAILLIALVTMMLSMGAVSVQAETTASKALQAYKEYLAKYENSISQFAVIRLTNDAVPELVVNMQSGYSYYYYVLTYENDSISTIGRAESGSMFSGYYKKKGVIVNFYAHGNAFGLAEDESFFSVKKAALAEMPISSYKYTSGKKSQTEYYNGSSKISKTKFNSILKKAVGSVKKEKIVYRKNTKYNRTTYVK